MLMSFLLRVQVGGVFYTVQSSCKNLAISRCCRMAFSYPASRRLGTYKGTDIWPSQSVWFA